MLFVSLGTSYQGRVEIRGRQKQISRPPSTAAMVSYLASDKGDQGTTHCHKGQ